MGGCEVLWEKAFQLAYFIVMDRASACQIAGRAIEKFGAQRSREKRRMYWRFRKTELKIRRITRTEEDTLQWLVFLESEQFEKEQERNGGPGETDMVIRYIKHLVQTTTAASSFYVNVGMNRLLRNYSTPEVQQVYELVTDSYPASEEYRKVKGRLMGRLAARFDGFVKICSSQYRELRFEADADQKRWIDLVDICVEAFSPWSSRGACLQGQAELDFEGPDGKTGRRIFHQPADGIETHRCHWFMHSPCCKELAKRLGFGSPQERLSVPKLSLKRNGGDDSGSGAAERRTTPLTETEMQELRNGTSSSDAKRQEIRLQRLKIVAHGAVCARLDPNLDERRPFDIPDGTKLLEVRTDSPAMELILATHWIDYTPWNGIAAGQYTITLQDNRELIFKVVPAPSGSQQEGGATVVVESRSSLPLVAWLNRLASFVPARQNLPQYALVPLLILIGWLGAATYYRNKLAAERKSLDRLAAEVHSLNVSRESQQARPQVPQAIATYLLSSENTLRGPGNPQEPVVTFAPGDSLVMLHLSIAESTPGIYRGDLSPFLAQQNLMAENLLKPRKSGNGWIVEFPLPSFMVAHDTHYLITLTGKDNKGQPTSVSRFVFKVRK